MKVIRICAMRCTLVILFATASASAAKIVVRCPDGTKPTSARIANNDTNDVTDGTLDGAIATFDKVDAETSYTARIELADGTILQGVDLSWNSEVPEKKDAGKLTNDDLKEIIALTTEIKSFYSSTEILQLVGNHDRAVGLMRLMRDGGFYHDKGGEIIWRMEVWYFKFQAGGWVKVQQANKILRRERFPDKTAFTKETAHLKFVPELGGLKLDKGESEKTIELMPTAGKENPPKVEASEEE